MNTILTNYTFRISTFNICLGEQKIIHSPPIYHIIYNTGIKINNFHNLEVHNVI